jgi:hypothetical protein
MAKGESSWFAIGFAHGRSDRYRGNSQFVRRVIQDEFQPAHVTAIDSTELRCVAIVIDLGLAGRTLPGHWGNRDHRTTIGGRYQVKKL